MHLVFGAIRGNQRSSAMHLVIGAIRGNQACTSYSEPVDETPPTAERMGDGWSDFFHTCRARYDRDTIEVRSRYDRDTSERCTPRNVTEGRAAGVACG